MDTLACFAFFSILGWILEVGYRSFNGRKFVNPGLLAGPYLILYGTSALALIQAASLLEGAGVIVKAIVYLMIITGLELAAGFAARYFFKVRLWDYSDQRFNYKGYICPRFSAYWVTAAFAFEYFIYPAYEKALLAAEPVTITYITLAIISVMFSDLIIVSVKGLFLVTPQEKERLERQYADIARPLLENRAVAALSGYPHHRAKTRLKHVGEVAYVSFLWGRKLSLDCDAIVRGALLHDLFHYDWLSEGPRLHGFRHPRIALENARTITTLSKKEEDIIIRHMWPLTVIPPLYPESMIVSAADKFCAARDYLSVVKSVGTPNEVIRRFVLKPSEKWIRQSVWTAVCRVRTLRAFSSEAFAFPATVPSRARKLLRRRDRS